MAKNKSGWIRARFYADDARPVKWPAPGPFWCTGYSDNKEVVVAYVKTEEQITEYWPEAEDVDAMETTEIEFSDRFPKPAW